MGGVEEVLGAAIEPPKKHSITQAMHKLFMLGALDERRNLTPLGRVLVQLPVDAHIGKLCIYGSLFRCLDSALTLAAVLSVRDPFVQPPELREEAQEAKDRFSSDQFRSDVLAAGSAYSAWDRLDERALYRASNEWCQENFLSKTTLVSIKQVKKSLLQALTQAGVIRASSRQTEVQSARDAVPAVLNQNSDSLPMLAALIAIADAPNFALRKDVNVLVTSQDNVSVIRYR